MRRRFLRGSVACLFTLCLGLIHGWLHQPMFAPAVHAQASGPVLSIPTGIPAGSPGSVVVPVNFARKQSGVTALTFAVEYDPACLEPAGDDLTSAVRFLAPPQFGGSVFLDSKAVGGELDIAIADYAPPLSTLADRNPLVELTFDVVCTPAAGQTITAAVRFGALPPVSFGDTLGQAVTGSTVDGWVEITRAGTQPPPTTTPDPGETPEPVNTAPTAKDDSAVTTEYRSVVIDVLANDIDSDDDPLSITEISAAGIGQVSLQPGGTLLYMPDPGRNGEDIFSYTISDGRGGLAAAYVHVTIGAFNIPPVAQDDTAVTDRDVPVTIDILKNDYDTDAVTSAAALSVGVLGQPGYGLAVLNVDNTVTYTPSLDYTGEDSFRYSVMDSEAGVGIATVMITVRAVNHPPQLEPPAGPLNYIAGQTLSLQIEATDLDGDPIHFTATGLPPGLTIDPDTGEIHGTPPPNAVGTYQVTVIADDGTSSTRVEFTLTLTQPLTSRETEFYVPQLMR